MDLRDALRHDFAFPAFRLGQAAALGHVLAGRDSLMVMPTGPGQSLVDPLAPLLRPGTALVISPLLTLMQDHVDWLTAHGVPATFITSTIPTAEQRARLARLAAGAYNLPDVAPERLRSCVFLEAFFASNVSLLAVDATHCVSLGGIEAFMIPTAVFLLLLLSVLTGLWLAWRLLRGSVKVLVGIGLVALLSLWWSWLLARLAPARPTAASGNRATPGPFCWHEFHTSRGR